MDLSRVTTAKSVITLIEQLNKLPGIGPKTAQRLAYHLLRLPKEEVGKLTEAIDAVKEKTMLCNVCQNISESDPCSVCQDGQRDSTKICIVEEPLDIQAIERTGIYKGLYHVLHGVISPMDGIGPDKLKIKELLPRLKDGRVVELLLATNPNLEGEATAMYISQLFKPLGLKITRLARGLPFGSDLEYADDQTITRAIEGREEM